MVLSAIKSLGMIGVNTKNSSAELNNKNCQPVKHSVEIYKFGFGFANEHGDSFERTEKTQNTFTQLPQRKSFGQRFREAAESLRREQKETLPAVVLGEELGKKIYGE